MEFRSFEFLVQMKVCMYIYIYACIYVYIEVEGLGVLGSWCAHICIHTYIDIVYSHIDTRI